MRLASLLILLFALAGCASTWANVAAIQADIPGASAALRDVAALVAKEIANQPHVMLPLGTK